MYVCLLPIWLTPSHDGVHALASTNYQCKGETIPQGIKVLGTLLDLVIDIAKDRLYSTNCDPGCSLVRHLGIKADK
jgi:hypothetical protein